MELKFVPDEEVAGMTRGRKNLHDWGAFLTELKSHPNRWVEFPDRVNYPNTAYRIAQTNKDYEVKVMGGNHLNVGDPAKLKWKVILRYVPQKDS